MQSAGGRLPIGLCIFGIAYSAGYTGNWGKRTDGKPIGPNDFIDLAVRLGLSSIEAPPEYFAPGAQKADLVAFRERAQEHGLFLVADGPKIDPVAFRPCLEQAAWLGAKVVRCVLSGILCGDRRPMGGYDGWQRHLEQMVQHLKTIAPMAEDLGLKIGIENHQDATSADLIRVCEEVGYPNVGITLDTGNPLAVGEDPVIFAERILPYLVHVHLKDYRMAATPSGYRLFHCPIGAGVVDFAALFRLFRTKPDVATHIEMAALGERHIRILEDEYWAGLGDRPISEVLPVLRLMRTAEVDVEWRTPWETGDEAILPTWEMQRLEESVARMGQVLAVVNQSVDQG
jgi:sugar phosphate isomerase/epimerase